MAEETLYRYDVPLLYPKLDTGTARGTRRILASV